MVCCSSKKRSLLGAASLAVLLLYMVAQTRRKSAGEVPPTERTPAKKRLGYFFALKYYEQQTQATKNFLQMQCLAHSYGMRVVEPFVQGSQIGFPFYELAAVEAEKAENSTTSTHTTPAPPPPLQKQQQQQHRPRRRRVGSLRLGDLMDMELWNREAADAYGYPPVASWPEFLADAPREVVLVCVRCRNPPKIRIPKPGANYRLGCEEDCFEKFDGALNFLRRHSFRLVRRVCSNFVAYAGSVSSEDFLRNILGGDLYKEGEVTVILNEFRGFFGLYRMQLLSPCGLLTHADMQRDGMQIMPSQQLVMEADLYAKEYFGDRPYISILVRVEKIVLHSHLNITECTDRVVSTLESLEQRRFEPSQIAERFLAMDVGRFGSSGAARYHLLPEGLEVFRRVYNSNDNRDNSRKQHQSHRSSNSHRYRLSGWSFEEWEESFARASSSGNPAYVANLQRTLAAKGHCLLMVGAGGFQVQARSLYEKYHPDVSSRCVYKICAG